MREDLKRFFIDKEMIKEENEIEEKHECNCDGDCGDNCKCHNDGIVRYGILCDDLINPMVISAETINPSIPIRYLDGAKELVINPKGNCIDVYAYEDVFIPYMGYCMINLGFAMQLPKGKIAKLYPRSSTFKKYGIIQTNHCGIIDETYCSDTDVWHMPVQCTMPKQVDKVMIGDKKITVAGTWIKKDDSIAQFEIVDAMEIPTFKKVESLNNVARGSSSVCDEYDKCGKSE